MVKELVCRVGRVVYFEADRCLVNCAGDLNISLEETGIAGTTDRVYWLPASSQIYLNLDEDLIQYSYCLCFY